MDDFYNTVIKSVCEVLLPVVNARHSRPVECRLLFCDHDHSCRAGSGSFMFKADSFSLKPASCFLGIKALISIPLFYYIMNDPQKGALDHNLYHPTGSIVTTCT
jgi:hypothetical protein